MKFAHRILIIQSISYNLCFYQVLPVLASPALPSICFLTYAIPRRDSCLLLSIGACRFTIFGYFFSSTVTYRFNLNSTTVCFVCKRSTHWSYDQKVGKFKQLPDLVHLFNFHLVNYIKMRESKNEFKTLVFSILIATTYICYIFLIFVAYSQRY